MEKKWTLADKSLAALVGLLIFSISIPFVISTSQELNDEVLAIVLQSDGKSVLGGRFTENRIMRKNTDGSHDESFSSTWTFGGFNQAVTSLGVQSDDKIIAGGEFTNFSDAILGSIARLNADGSLDRDFCNQAGTGFNDTVTAVYPQPDGKILVGGLFTAFNGSTVNHIARLNSDGSLDTSFAPGEGFDAPVLAMAGPASGPLLIGGSFLLFQGTSNPYLSRMALDGSGQTSFSLKLSD